MGACMSGMRREQNVGSLAVEASKQTLTVVTRATSHSGARSGL